MSCVKRLVLGFVSSLLIACGGAEGTGLFSPPSSEDADAALSRVDASSPAPKDAGVPPQDATVRDGAADAHKDAPVDATIDATIDATVDAPYDAPDDAIADADIHDALPADTGPLDPGIHCAGDDCTPGSEVCCRQRSATDAFQCVNAAGCQAISLMPIPCDDAEDCETLGDPGAVCCGTYQYDILAMGDRVYQVACRQRSACTSLMSRVIICDPNVPNACPVGKTCTKSIGTFVGYYLCL